MKSFRIFSLILFVAVQISAMPTQVRAEHGAPSPAHDREKGGLTDPAEHAPVNPDTTPFSTGSVGKPFTWMAVMQLVEQGKLDLNAEVNTYLDFKIPAAYSEPIMLNHLMTPRTCKLITLRIQLIYHAQIARKTAELFVSGSIHRALKTLYMGLMLPLLRKSCL